MDGEAVLLDENFYNVLVAGGVLYLVTWLNTLVPSSTEVTNPWAKAGLQAWEALSANVLRSAPAPGKGKEGPP